jgi:hypothetical protein
VKTFPAEFADILSPKGKSILTGNAPDVARTFRASNPHYISVHGIVETDTANACGEVLNKLHYGALKPMKQTIPRDSIRKMKTNYSEQLGKNMSMRTSYLTSRKERELGLQSGLLRMLQSESFHLFAEGITGCSLRSDWGCQIICYEHGDCAGPHNDHHPEYERIRNGYACSQSSCETAPSRSRLGTKPFAK